jgi:DNA repair protein RecO (recombination protein O)
MEYKYTGIILNKRDIGETDRLYTVYTLEDGKIKSVAKGVRKPEAKLASSLETFDLVDLTVVKNRGNGKIAGSIIEESYPFLKNNYEALFEVFQGLALFDKIVDIGSRDSELFALLSDYLSVADLYAKKGFLEDKNKLLRIGFSVKLMETLGYKMEATACTICGCNFSGKSFYFNPEMGGFVCQKCGERKAGMLIVSANTIKIIRIFFHNKLQTFEKINIEKKDLEILTRLLQNFLQWSF